MGEFLLPDLGEGLPDAQIVRWLVAVGDIVEIDQPIVEVETAKAVLEIPSPYAGRVAVLHAGEGESVEVGLPLITIEPVVAESPAPVPADARPADPAVAGGVEGAVEPEGRVDPEVAVEPEGRVEPEGGNVLIGYGPSEPARRRRRAAPTVAHQTRSVGVISPVVRRLARDGGLDLASVTGTGPGGLIRRCDVEDALASKWTAAPAAHPLAPGAAAGTAPDPAGGVPPIAAADGIRASAPADGTRVGAPADGSRVEVLADGTQVAASDEGTRVPMTAAGRFAAAKYVRSRSEIPEVTIWVEVDATDLGTLRAELQKRLGTPVGFVAMLSRFVTAGLRRFPALNARIDGDAVVQLRDVHLGIAAQTERGLAVPVLRDAGSLSIRELSTALGELTEQARAGALAPAQLSGSTFTVNNYGVFGTDGSTPIINHPEVAMIGIGRIIDRPWVVDGELAVRKVGTLTLAFDHRACDGEVAGNFLRFVADCIENPATAVAEI